MRPSRRAAVGAALLACCAPRRPPARALDLPQPLIELKQKLDDDAALEQRVRSEALQPNKYGTFTPVPPPPPPQNVLEDYGGFTGRLAPEYDGDTRERYSNPYAARLNEVAKERPALLSPGVPDVPVYRTGLSVKPKNLQCDPDGRNCKFTGASPAVKPVQPYTPPAYEETAEYLRDQLKEENRKIREANLAKAKLSPEERAAVVAEERAAAAAARAAADNERNARKPEYRADVLGGGLREDDNTRRAGDRADALRAARNEENRRIREANLAKQAAKQAAKEAAAAQL